MDSRLVQLWQPWIPARRIEGVIQLEPALMLLLLAAAAWVLYKTLLRKVSAERHRNMRRHFWDLGLQMIITAALFGAYSGLQGLGAPEDSLSARLVPYVGLFTLLWGAVVFVKTARILAFVYLFVGHMRVGVPLLLVNIFTLLLSILVGVWLVTAIFEIKLAPILATSAVFSIVLGLALQDTLGNLFAGVAMQFDKPYELGDWIEIANGTQRWAGYVEEISWRATLLRGLFDELITVPNRTVALAEVSNFSAKDRPILRRQILRIPFGHEMDRVRTTLLRAATSVSSVHSNPSPLILISDTTDSWVECKLVYFISDYGRQFIIADQVFDAALRELERAGIPLAQNRLSVSGVAAATSAPA